MLPPEFISRKLLHAFLGMPDKARQVVWLADVEEHTYREISERLEIPIGTVMSRLHRGRAMLRVKFIKIADRREFAQASPLNGTV